MMQVVRTLRTQEITVLGIFVVWNSKCFMVLIVKIRGL